MYQSPGIHTWAHCQSHFATFLQIALSLFLFNHMHVDDHEISLNALHLGSLWSSLDSP